MTSIWLATVISADCHCLECKKRKKTHDYLWSNTEKLNQIQLQPVPCKSQNSAMNSGHSSLSKDCVMNFTWPQEFVWVQVKHCILCTLATIPHDSSGGFTQMTLGLTWTNGSSFPVSEFVSSKKELKQNQTEA